MTDAPWTLVDPRDTVWEKEITAFRVSVWTSASSCAEYETTSDLPQVLGWVGQQTHAANIELWALVDTRDGRGRVLLASFSGGTTDGQSFGPV